VFPKPISKEMILFQGSTGEGLFYYLVDFYYRIEPDNITRKSDFQDV